MVLDEEEVQGILKANMSVPNWVVTAREQSDKLFALMHGDDFIAMAQLDTKGLHHHGRGPERIASAAVMSPLRPLNRLKRPTASVCFIVALSISDWAASMSF